MYRETSKKVHFLRTWTRAQTCKLVQVDDSWYFKHCEATAVVVSMMVSETERVRAIVNLKRYERKLDELKKRRVKRKCPDFATPWVKNKMSGTWSFYIAPLLSWKFHARILSSSLFSKFKILLTIDNLVLWSTFLSIFYFASYDFMIAGLRRFHLERNVRKCP